MKTPKREYKKFYIDPATGEPDEWALGNIDARWKRKNRIRALKHTIAILTERLKDTEKALIWTQKFTKCFLVRPSHWHPLDANGKQYTRKQWRQAMKSRNEKR